MQVLFQLEAHKKTIHSFVHLKTIFLIMCQIILNTGILMGKEANNYIIGTFKSEIYR